MEVPDPVELSDLQRAPVGPWVGSRTIVFWWARPDIRLIAIWGSPSESDTELLLGAMTTQIAPGTGRHASFVDLRDLDRVDPAPFARLAAWMIANKEALAAVITASAIVHQGELFGAITAGYQGTTGVGYPHSRHADPRAALDWLGVGDGDDLLAGLAARVDWQRHGGDLVTRLRRAMAADPRRHELAAYAAALGTSPRSLQRELARRNTGFLAELLAARIERARVLLRDPEHKVLTVALAVGFEKEQSFADAFRRVEGVSPSEWRRAQGRSRD